MQFVLQASSQQASDPSGSTAGPSAHSHTHTCGLPQGGMLYNVVIASEVVEHVKRPDTFIKVRS